MKKILVVSAHADDEVLGAGATIRKLAEEDNEIYCLFIAQGLLARNSKEEKDIIELQELHEYAKKAGEILGFKEIFFLDFPDNRCDSVNLLDIIKEIENYIEKIKPEIIFTHHHGDLNIDHRITFKAVMTACRPQNCPVKKIYCFEIPSSTDWNVQNASTIFIPNTYFNITATINNKLQAIKEYKSEIREYPHPRSIEALEVLAKKRGIEVGLKYAEAFCMVRNIKE